MAIADYTTLQTAVAAWLARADLTANIPDFIQLAEARLSRDLKCRQQITTATGTAAAGLIAIPSDLLSIIRLSITSGGYDIELEAMTSAQGLNDRFGGTAYGYVVEGTNLRIIGGSATPAYTLSYYATIPALASNSTNWLLTLAPDVYLYAALLEATPFIQDDSRISIWAGAYKVAVDSIQRLSDDARWTPGARQRLSMRTP